MVIFPALDVFPSFSVNAISLSDNLMTLGYGSVPQSYYLACLTALLSLAVQPQGSAGVDRTVWVLPGAIHCSIDSAASCDQTSS